MQNIEVYDKPQSQWNREILNTLKEWAHQHDVRLSHQHYQSLFNICKKIYDNCYQEIKQISVKLQETIISRREIAERLIEYQKENIDLKQMLDQYQQENREISERFQESKRELQCEKQQNSAELRLKQKIEKENLELSMRVDLKEQEIFSLNLSLQNLKGEISQMSERDTLLIKTNRTLKQKCDNYQISDEIMRCQNEQLKAQVNKLKQLIEEKRELINRYMSSQQIDQYESNAERGSIYAASEFADQVQYEQNQDHYHETQSRMQKKQSDQNNQVLVSNRQLFHDIQQNNEGNSKASGCYRRRNQMGFSPYDSENSQSKQSNSQLSQSMVSNSSQVSVEEKKKFKRSKNQGNHNSLGCLNKIGIDSTQTNKKLQAASPCKVSLQISQKCSQKNSPKYQKNIRALQQELTHNRKIIAQLKEQIKFLKRNNQRSAPAWTRSFRHQDFEELQNKVRFYKRISNENHERFLEMRSEKQYYEILSRTMKQQFELQETKYRQVFAEKLNLLAQEHTKRTNRFGEMFQKGIEKLAQLNHELLLENKFKDQNNLKKDKFNIVLNGLGPQEILELNERDLRSGLESSRHNISQDQSQSIHLEQNQGLQICTGRKTCSVGLRTSRILQDKNENEQSSSQSESQLENLNPSQTKQQCVAQYTDHCAQTENVVCFFDQEEAKIKGYYKCYFQDNEVQTEFHQNREVLDVGVQVQIELEFTLQTSSQTDISVFPTNHQKSFSHQTSQSSNMDSKQLSTTFISFNDTIFKPVFKQFQQFSQTEGTGLQESKLEESKRIDVDSSYETDQNYTNTINKKNVFKINLEHVVRKEIDLDEKMSSRIEKSTARDSEGHTDRKLILTPKSSHRQSIYQEDFSYGLSPQDVINEEERQSSYQNQADILFGDSSEYVSQEIQTQPLMGISIGVQIDPKLFDEVYQDQRGDRNYLVTQQSEDQQELSSDSLKDQGKFQNQNQISSQEQSSRKDDSDQFTIKKQIAKKIEKDTCDQSTRDKSKKKSYNIQLDFQKPQPLNFEQQTSRVEQGIQQPQSLEHQEINQSRANLQQISELSEFQNQVDDYLANLQKQSFRKQVIQDIFEVQEHSVIVKDLIQIQGSTIWDINQTYIIKTCLAQDESIQDWFIFWKNGILSLKNQQYLRLESQGACVSDPKMLILGDSEILAWGKKMWIRNKSEETRCYAGSLKDCNLTILERYCYTIQ